jgi:hypothetical protein
MIAAQPVIVDLRGKLPRNSNTGIRFHRRTREDIRGVVVHQVLGTSSVEQVAKYHSSLGCHLAPETGAPGICYAFFVDYDGTIDQCNDLEDITWSQGGSVIGPNGGQPNTNYLSIVVRGNFTGPGYVGTEVPSPAQVDAVAKLWRWLRDSLGLEADALYGHADFGKPACPGDVLMQQIEILRREPSELSSRMPSTVEEWQRALVLLGFDLGTAGPAHDGVDGDWGQKSDVQLATFQARAGIPRKGRDDWTALHLARALLNAGKPPGCLRIEAADPATTLAMEPAKRRQRHGPAT